tara:strand:+ start:11 stop:1858 length:1848 start_codon:yes stop_codon:yes gene_type:complete
MNFIYNLSTNYPLFGLSASLLLFLGFNQLGTIILKNKNIYSIISELSDVRYQKTLIAINFAMIFLFPIVLFFKFSKEFILLFSISLIILGIIQSIEFIKKWKFHIHTVNKINLENIIIILFLLGYFFLSISPITHADALGYHASVAKFIASSGRFPSELNNFENLLTGSGEIVMSLGFLYNSEQLGNLVQFSGLLSLIGVVRKNSNDKGLFSLLILSTPIIIFLCSSPKPQLFSIASNALVFTTIFLNRTNFLHNRKVLFSIAIIILVFLTNSINTKFSFILSGGILYIASLEYFYKKNFLRIFLFLSIIIFSFFYFPHIYWKFYNWGGDIYQYILNPFPTHLPGFNNFESYLTNYRRDIPLIYLLIPMSMGTFTNTMGVCLIFLVLIPKIQYKLRIKIILIILFYLVIVSIKGQITGRFLIEPIFWLIIILSKEKIKINNFFRIPLYIQSCVVFLFLIFATLNLFPGSLTKSLYEKTMNKYANGYSLYSWANSVISDEGTIISMHRSISLGKNKTLSANFLSYLSKTDNPEIYINDMQKYNPKYFLTFQNSIDDLDKNVSIFKNCLGIVISKKKEVGFYTGRNPFNKGNSYSGILYEIKSNHLSDCINMNLLNN